MSRKYVGMDVHQSTTTIAVCDDRGEYMLDGLQVSTEREPVQMALESVGEHVSVAFEESTLARWMYRTVKEVTDDIVVCHPSDLPRDRGSKTDVADARKLAKYLRLGELTEVYYGSGVDATLKEYVKTYDKLTENLVRAKNRLKDAFRKRNVSCGGSQIYGDDWGQWLNKLEDPAARQAATVYHQQIDLLDEQRATLKDKMVQRARQTDGWSSIHSLPGFGEIRSARLLGLMGTPYRFRTKRQLWRYSGLAVEIHDSSQYTQQGPDGTIEHRHEVKTRGLNNDGRPELKDIFKSAAETAHRCYEEVRQDFRIRCQSKGSDLAKLDIARKLASQCLTIWKRKETYDAEKARWKTTSSVD